MKKLSTLALITFHSVAVSAASLSPAMAQNQDTIMQDKKNIRHDHQDIKQDNRLIRDINILMNHQRNVRDAAAQAQDAKTFRKAKNKLQIMHRSKMQAHYKKSLDTRRLAQDIDKLCHDGGGC